MTGAIVSGHDERGVRVIEACSREERLEEISIRWDVFVVEQGVAPVLEIDQRDFRDDVHHFLAVDPQDVALGTARIIPDGTGELVPHGQPEELDSDRLASVHLGRLAVRREARGRKVGAALVRAVHEFLRASTPVGTRVRVVLDAQVHALGFYERLGYVDTGKSEYLDAGIVHREMSQVLWGSGRGA